MRKAVTKVILIALILALGLLAFNFLPDSGAKAPKIPYTEFRDLAASGLVRCVTISDEKLLIETEDGLLSTDNPQSLSLRETLLEKGIEVRSDDSRTLNEILDLVFDAVFFSAVGFGIYKLVSTYSRTFKVVRRTGTTFSDIVGMEDVKKQMSELCEILRNPEEYRKKGIRPVRGVVLEGPPGNGKTLFARALAQEAGVSFIAAKGADFQSALMSMGAAKIKMLFSKAAKRKPCIIFIDEFDSIGERRNYAGSGIDKENNRIITTMLNEMDGFESSDGILVIAATNSYASLDPALVRPGRFDIRFTVSNPDCATREKLFEMYLKGRTLADGLDYQTLARATEGCSCAAVEALCNQAKTLSEDVIDASVITQSAQNIGFQVKNNVKKK